MKHAIALLAATSLTAFANSDPGTDINTPMGRIVWGHPLKPKHKTDANNVKQFNDDGSPKMEVSFGLAIPTAEFQASVWPAMAAEAAKGYPQGFPGNFSWKMTQEQEVDKQGKPYGQREGYAGCVVLAISTVLAPPSAMVYENGAYRQIGEAEIKCGDFVMVGLNLKVNVPSNRSHTPSLYVNPRLIVKCYDGDAISSGSFDADPTQVFGAAPVIPPPPPGARPIGAPAHGGMPPAGTMPGAAPMQQPQGVPGQQQMGNAPMNPATAGMPAPTPAYPSNQMPPPATDFIPGGYAMPGQAAPGGMPGMPQR